MSEKQGNLLRNESCLIFSLRNRDIHQEEMSPCVENPRFCFLVIASTVPDILIQQVEGSRTLLEVPGSKPV
jgi:hypothetical protein